MYQQYLNQIGNISLLSTEELNELLNDDDKVDEKITQALSSLESEKDIIMTENRTLAEANLGREPYLIELKSRINDLHEEGKTLCSSVQEKQNEIKSKTGDLSPDTALALLQTSACESEEESEKLYSSFLEGEVTIDVFVDQFLSLRKIMHSRKVKAEKMVDLLKQPLTNGKVSGLPYSLSPRAQPTSSFYPPNTGATMVPYPVGPISMPMPGMYSPQF